MANTEPAYHRVQTAIGNHRYGPACPLPEECRRNIQHFGHAGATLRPLISQYKNIAFTIIASLHHSERGICAVKTAGGPNIWLMVRHLV